MSRRKGFLLVILAVTCALSTQDSTYDSITNWETFKSIFNKTYENPVEEAARKEAFYRSLHYVQTNSGKDGVKLAINVMSDWLEEELVRLGSTLPSPNVTFLSAKSSLHSALNASYPDFYDIRYLFTQTPVQDQGRCGSCYAFATLAIVENLGAMIAPLKRTALSRMKIHLPGRSLSAQSIVDCSSGNRGCRGGYFGETLKFIRKHGIVSKARYPYHYRSNKAQRCRREVIDRKEFQYSYGRFFRMRVYSLEDEETIKIMLNQYGMVGATMFITRHFRHYKGGVIRHDRGKRLGGHGVVIIGYDRDAEGVEYWTIRNSWGHRWGEEGYFRIERGKNLFHIKEGIHVFKWGRLKDQF